MSSTGRVIATDVEATTTFAIEKLRQKHKSSDTVGGKFKYFITAVSEQTGKQERTEVPRDVFQTELSSRCGEKTGKRIIKKWCAELDATPSLKEVKESIPAPEDY